MNGNGGHMLLVRVLLQYIIKHGQQKIFQKWNEYITRVEKVPYKKSIIKFL